MTTPGTTWRARRLVVCGGLQADRLSRLAGLTSAARIVPFRGESFQLPREQSGIVEKLMYPVPDPFLGVHLTPVVDGRVTVGPNAVLGLAREGYRKGSVNRRDVRDILTFPGFWRLARGQVRTGTVEMRNSLFKRGYLGAARRYCPSLPAVGSAALRGRHPGAGGAGRRPDGARPPTGGDPAQPARAQRPVARGPRPSRSAR
ncbi:MAG: FAD-dependent oxidoreductase [Blastococcus sp.]